MNADLPSELSGRGTGWVVAQIPLLLVAIVAPMAERMSGGHGSWPRATTAIARAIGLAGMGISLTLFWQAKRTLGSGLVPYPKPPEGAVLQQTGVYGRVRHPVYLGLLCAALSWAVLWRSRLGLALLVPSIAFFRAKSQYEERFLLARFPEYAGYRRRVPAFVPHWRVPAKGEQ